jgi:enoyl-CoA hydratase
MNYQSLLTEADQGTLTVTINRPEKLNALNNLVLGELEAIIDEVYQNASIRSVIITGSGKKAFVAGADISEFLSVRDKGRELAERGQAIFAKIENSPKPFLAAVNGFALGGGCELAMACHLRIAASGASFGQPEINLGIFPGYGGTQRLTQLIGKGRALELLLTGKMINAETALQFGLVNAISEPEQLLDSARKMLGVINSKAPQAIAHCIKAVNAVHDHLKNGYEVEAEGFGTIFTTEDMQEGATAFLEKRAPNFTGR